MSKKNKNQLKENAKKLIDELSKIYSPAYFFKEYLDENGRICLDNPNREGLNTDKTAMNTLAICHMLRSGYKLKDILNPEKLQEERQAAGKEFYGIYHKLSDESFSFIMAEYMIFSIEKVIVEINWEVAGLTEITGSELIKPEHSHIFKALTLLKDLGEELGRGNIQQKSYEIYSREHMEKVINAQLGGNFFLNILLKAETKSYKMTEGRIDLLSLQDINQDVEQEINQDIEQEIEQEINQDIEQDIEQEINQDIEQNIKQDIQDIKENKDVRDALLSYILPCIQAGYIEKVFNTRREQTGSIEVYGGFPIGGINAQNVNHIYTYISETDDIQSIILDFIFLDYIGNLKKLGEAIEDGIFKNSNVRIDKKRNVKIEGLKANIERLKIDESIYIENEEKDEADELIEELSLTSVPDGYQKFRTKEYDFWHKVSNLPEEIQGCGNVRELAEFYIKNKKNLSEEEKNFLTDRILNNITISDFSKRIKNGDIDIQSKVIQKDNSYSFPDVNLDGPQSTDNGCWSCSLAYLLRSRGIEIEQREVREYRVGVSTDDFMKVKGDSMKALLDDQPSTIEENADIVINILPNTGVFTREVGGGTLEERIELFSKTLKEAFIVNSSPLSINIGGHYLTITGFETTGPQNEWKITYQDSFDGAVNHMTTTEKLVRSISEPTFSMSYLVDINNQNDISKIENENIRNRIKFDEENNIIPQEGELKPDEKEGACTTGFNFRTVESYRSKEKTSEEKTSEENASNEWGKPTENASNEWGKPTESASNEWGKPTESASNEWGKPAENASNEWGKPTESASNEWRKLAENKLMVREAFYMPKSIDPEVPLKYKNKAFDDRKLERNAQYLNEFKRLYDAILKTDSAFSKDTEEYKAFHKVIKDSLAELTKVQEARFDDVFSQSFKRIGYASRQYKTHHAKLEKLSERQKKRIKAMNRMENLLRRWNRGEVKPEDNLDYMLGDKFTEGYLMKEANGKEAKKYIKLFCSSKVIDDSSIKVSNNHPFEVTHGEQLSDDIKKKFLCKPSVQVFENAMGLLKMDKKKYKQLLEEVDGIINYEANTKA